MFGWVKRRRRREQIKLLKQNEIAIDYLLGFENAAGELGLVDNGALVDSMELTAFAIRRHLNDLNYQQLLDASIIGEQLMANKNLRCIYDAVLNGKKMSAQRFGFASEKLESFDTTFQPKEGWKIFLDHFGESFQDQLNRFVK